MDQFAPGLFGRVAALLAVMPPFARAELEQIGRKMAFNEYFGASLTQINWKRNLTVYESGDKLRLSSACLGIIPPSRHKSTHCSSSCDHYHHPRFVVHETLPEPLPKTKQLLRLYPDPLFASIPKLIIEVV